MAKDPTAVAQRWASQLGAAGQKITEGVQAVTVAPGQAAARQKSVYLGNVQASADKWARNTAAVSLSDWQQAMINKGASRVGSGAQAAIPKMTTFLQKFLPHVESVKNSLPPRGNYDQNKQRALAMMDGVHKFSNT